MSASAISVTGTLTHSTHFQLRPEVSTPPSRTPTAPAAPETAPQTPSALLRSAPSVNSVVTIESADGEMNAAPNPCAARAAINSPRVDGESRGQRGHGDRRQPGHEHTAAAQEIRGATAQQQKPTERDYVRVHHPRQVLVGEVQPLADARQGHVHDRGVENDDQLRDRQQRQRDPAPIEFSDVLVMSNTSCISDKLRK